VQKQSNGVYSITGTHHAGKPKNLQRAESQIRRQTMEDINRILVVSRDTKYCREAVHQGISLARKYGAKISIIHVVHNPFGLEGWNLPTVALDEEYLKIIKEAKEDLDRIITLEKAKGLSINELIRGGEPTEEILKAVKEENIDLLIMLAHEEGRLEHFLFGRSNEELIRKMPCSILLVKKEPKPVKW
jgi:nucleotide-binding universal stress UspA family protein